MRVESCRAKRVRKDFAASQRQGSSDDFGYGVKGCKDAEQRQPRYNVHIVDNASIYTTDWTLPTMRQVDNLTKWSRRGGGGRGGRGGPGGGGAPVAPRRRARGRRRKKDRERRKKGPRAARVAWIFLRISVRSASQSAKWCVLPRRRVATYPQRRSCFDRGERES